MVRVLESYAKGGADEPRYCPDNEGHECEDQGAKALIHSLLGIFADALHDCPTLGSTPHVDRVWAGDEAVQFAETIRPTRLRLARLQGPPPQGLFPADVLRR